MIAMRPSEIEVMRASEATSTSSSDGSRTSNAPTEFSLDTPLSMSFSSDEGSDLRENGMNEKMFEEYMAGGDASDASDRDGEQLDVAQQEREVQLQGDGEGETDTVEDRLNAQFKPKRGAALRRRSLA